jgi:hypothetical protein
LQARHGYTAERLAAFPATTRQPSPPISGIPDNVSDLCVQLGLRGPGFKVAADSPRPRPPPPQPRDLPELLEGRGLPEWGITPATSAATWTVNVKHAMTGATISVPQLSPQTLVQSLKSQLEAALGVEASLQSLIHRGNALLDSQTLAECEIQVRAASSCGTS